MLPLMSEYGQHLTNWNTLSTALHQVLVWLFHQSFEMCCGQQTEERVTHSPCPPTAHAWRGKWPVNRTAQCWKALWENQVHVLMEHREQSNERCQGLWKEVRGEERIIEHPHGSRYKFCFFIHIKFHHVNFSFFNPNYGILILMAII